jgi:hypothetical protein
MISRGSIAGDLLTEEDKGKAGMGSYLHTGIFDLGPGLIIWLNWQFYNLL